MIVTVMCLCDCVVTVEVCSGKKFNASCTSGTVLMIDSAKYGRMKIGGKCRISTYNVGCSADVSSYVERHCAGRRNCEMPVSDDIRTFASDHHGCPSDQLGYLRVAYYCLPGKQHTVTSILQLLLRFSTLFIQSFIYLILATMDHMTDKTKDSG